MAGFQPTLYGRFWVTPEAALHDFSPLLIEWKTWPTFRVREAIACLLIVLLPKLNWSVGRQG
jgi:hypothetical protein